MTMKRNVSYLNHEEKNGIFLLTTLMLLFSIFVFLQKRILPSQSTISVNIQEFIDEEFYQKDMHLSSGISGSIVKKEVSENKADTKQLPTKKVTTVKSEDHKERFKSIHIDFQEKVDNKKEQKKRSSFSKKKAYKKVFPTKTNNIKSFNLNSSDPEDWKQIKGIGDGYSSRIIKYQKWLGGFYSVHQLKEVYGLKDSLVQEMIPYIVNTQNYRKIKINFAESKELGSHPYLSWKEANIIVKYRKHHFPLTKDSFKLMMGVSKETKSKILPYLDFTPLEEPSLIEENNVQVLENQQDTTSVKTVKTE